jgi:hypothetical protein
MAKRFPIATICGSMRYFQKMLTLADRLTCEGWIILMPFSDFSGDRPPDHVKEMLDEMHLIKIAMSDTVFVVGTHKGESTLAEIQYARDHQQEVIFISNP